MFNFARLFYPTNTKRKVLRGPAFGLTFIVKPSMGFSFAVGSTDVFTKMFFSKVRAADVIFDIGANRGQMALPLSKLVGSKGHIFSFEPVPEVFKDLLENIKMNRLINVTAFQYLLADQTGEVFFSYSSDFSTQGKISNVEPSHSPKGQSMALQSYTIDSLLDNGFSYPDFVKIDTEGAAGLILSGGKKLLKSQKVRFFIEIHGPEELQGIFKYFSDTDYSFFDETGKQVNVKDFTYLLSKPTALYCCVM